MSSQSFNSNLICMELQIMCKDHRSQLGSLIVLKTIVFIKTISLTIMVTIVNEGSSDRL